MRAVSVEYLSLQPAKVAQHQECLSKQLEKKKMGQLSPDAYPRTYEKMRSPNPAHILQTIYKNSLAKNTCIRYTLELSYINQSEALV